MVQGLQECNAASEVQYSVVTSHNDRVAVLRQSYLTDRRLYTDELVQKINDMDSQQLANSWKQVGRLTPLKMSVYTLHLKEMGDSPVKK